MMRTVFILGACLLACVSANAHMEQVEVDVDLKPNGQAAFGIAKMARDNGKDVTCKFAWSVVGGTNEQWIISLEKQGNEYICTVARPEQTSYLYFMHFTLSFEDGAVVTDAEVFDNSKALEKGKAFVVSKNEVRVGDGFKNELARIVARRA